MSTAFRGEITAGRRRTYETERSAPDKACANPESDSHFSGSLPLWGPRSIGPESSVPPYGESGREILPVYGRHPHPCPDSMETEASHTGVE